MTMTMDMTWYDTNNHLLRSHVHPLYLAVHTSIEVQHISPVT